MLAILPAAEGPWQRPRSTAPNGPFTIRGNTSGRLAPGISQPLNLSVANAQPFRLSITGLTVTLKDVSAPNADAAKPCTLVDFAVEQFSGPPFTVEAANTSSLGDLGLPTGHWPRIGMRDLPTNQDGCKDAQLTLTYSAVGIAP